MSRRARERFLNLSSPHTRVLCTKNPSLRCLLLRESQTWKTPDNAMMETRRATHKATFFSLSPHDESESKRVLEGKYSCRPFSPSALCHTKEKTAWKILYSALLGQQRPHQNREPQKNQPHHATIIISVVLPFFFCQRAIAPLSGTIVGTYGLDLMTEEHHIVIAATGYFTAKM